MSNKQKGHDYSSILIWAACLVSVVRYAGAFISSDVGKIEGSLSEWITILLGISGVGMGLLDTIGATYLFDGWRRAMPKSGDKWSFRFKILTAFVFSLFISGVIILVPFTMSRVAHVSVLDVLGNGLALAIWSTLVNAAPALLIGGVATGQQVVNVTQNEHHANSEQTSERAGEQANEKTNGSRTFASLNEEDKYFIFNNSSKTSAVRFGVSGRAIQKWRKRVQDEISQGKL